MIKAIYIKETGSYEVHLPAGKWKIEIESQEPQFVDVSYGGKKVEVRGNFKIQSVRETSFVINYINNKEELISSDDYEDQKWKLQQKGVYDEDEGGYGFENIDDEYKYKKFIKEWTAIFKSITTYGDSEPIEYLRVVTKTENKFIIPMYSIGGDPSIYIFNKAGAAKEITEETMRELGMVFEGNVDYKATKNKKVWGNSTNSGIRFVAAFGTYIFNDSFDFTKQPNERGTLEQMTQRFENLKKEIRGIIISNYKSHFGEFDKNKLENFAKILIGDLEAIRNSAFKIEAKKSSLYTQRDVLAKCRELQDRAKDLFIS